MIQVSFAADISPQHPLIYGVFSDDDWGEYKSHAHQGGFTGKPGETLNIHESQRTIILLGLGPREESAKNLWTIGGKCAAHLLPLPYAAVTLSCPALSLAELEEIAFGAALRAWRFDTYRTQVEKPVVWHTLTLHTSSGDAETFSTQWQPLIEGSALARRLVCEPGNVLYPESFAQEAQNLSALGVHVTVMDKEALKAMKAGALLGVAQGSEKDPFLVTLEWKGTPSDHPLALVGKGVTFDSGGLSLKPAKAMESMIADMAGAGALLGVMKTLALRKAPVHVVATLALVENMPSGSAQRPGDIVTSLSGQTIQVLNTDAEGRLILADALWYTQQHFQPRAMVNIATLTGAIGVALGDQYGGLFSNNDDLAQALVKSGELTQEPLWRLPLHKNYDTTIDCDVADMKNISDAHVGAGSITAAQFLQRFVNNVPWAHLDVGGVDFIAGSTPLSCKGFQAFGVRLLDHLCRTY